MAGLKLSDFKNKKKASGGPYTGTDYNKIIENKINDQSPFTIGTTAGGSSVWGTSSVTDKLGKITLYYVNTKTSTKPTGNKLITSFFKDPDFGGGKGSGGGAQDTTWTESLQCYYLSLLYNTTRSKLDNKNTTLKDLQSQQKFCYTYDKTKKIKAKECWDNCPEDWFEKDVFIKTANAIYNSPIGKKFNNKIVYIHRGSPFMDSIYKNKKKAFKFDRKNPPTTAPGSFSDDKWNPGDIWMSTQPPKIKEPFEGSPEEWTILRESVIKNVEKKLTLGISLKKVVGGIAKVTEYNTRKRSHNESVKYLGFTFGQTGDFFNSADIYIHFSSPSAVMQLRATATTSSWQGEMKGKHAAAGKIGGGNVNFYVENNFKRSIGSTGIIKGWKEIKYSKTDFNDMYKLYKRFINKQKTGIKEQTVVEQKEFEQLANAYVNPRGTKSAPAFYFGKYMCLKFLEAIKAESKSTVKLNGFATDIVRYASSNTDISSYFIKVS